nr:hypothetical protein WMHIBSEC_WMHIBSEC_CDS_0046 [Caudoviricetes sp.]CAI9751773.1 hypothetical protein AZFZUZMX_AZFZUZMX_CDS_0046 [Caudoviricetes sp.]
MSNKKIKGYKGFDKDLKCLGFQYEVGKDYEQEGEIRCCENGFHLCENPLDVFEYYSPTEGHRFCEVEGSGKMDKYGNKMSFSKIHISAEIGLSGIINAGVKFILDKVNLYGNKATNTGDCSAATNTGDRSAATNTGNCSAATNTGDLSAATNTGNYSAATNTGNYSAATNTGDCSAATNTGDRSAATNTGDCSAATNTGDYSAAEVKGKDSIAIVTGINSKARGAKGCWIVLTERDEDWHILDVKAFKVDGVKIKTNTFYMLKDGEPVEYGKDEQE